MNGLAASRPWATTSSVGAVAPPSMSSTAFSVASASTIMIATSPSGQDAAGDDHVEDGALELARAVGKATHWPSIRATRVPPTGPVNGRPESWVDADAALMARTSYEVRPG